MLEPTSLPPELVEDLIGGASPVWLMGQPAEVVAGDLVLAHPPLADGEVRAAVKPTLDAGAWRLTVAARDRAGLLADIAGVLAVQDLSITSISACAWPAHELAILRLAVASRQAMTDADWDRVGEGLRASLSGEVSVCPADDFQPCPPVRVTATPAETGRVVLRLEAPDRVGLIWALASWLAERGANIEVARVDTNGDMADDTFVIDGDFDAAELARFLSGTGSAVGVPVVGTVVTAAAAVGGSVLAAVRGQFDSLARRLPFGRK